jgi:hypothetical protein
MADVVRCAVCDDPATCIGSYPGDPEQASCDVCCGHDGLDGFVCRPIYPFSPDSQADGFRE